jgi:hypothetical protein
MEPKMVRVGEYFINVGKGIHLARDTLLPQLLAARA